MTPATQTFLPVDFKQLFELAKQLPKKEQQKLADLLLQTEETRDSVSDKHKNLVRARIKKYDKHPELLVDEKQALEMIKKI